MAVMLHTNEKSSKDVAISWPLVAFCTGRLEALPWLQVIGTTARGKEAEVGERTRREERGGGRKRNGGNGGKGGVKETKTCKV